MLQSCFWTCKRFFCKRIYKGVTLLDTIQWILFGAYCSVDCCGRVDLPCPFNRIDESTECWPDICFRLLSRREIYLFKSSSLYDVIHFWSLFILGHFLCAHINREQIGFAVCALRQLSTRKKWSTLSHKTVRRYSRPHTHKPAWPKPGQSRIHNAFFPNRKSLRRRSFGSHISLPFRRPLKFENIHSIFVSLGRCSPRQTALFNNPQLSFLAIFHLKMLCIIFSS